MRRAPALLIAAALVLVSLTACSTDPNTSCATAATSGTASKLISVSGPFGSKPHASIPTPLTTLTTQSTTAIEGSGTQLQKNQEIAMNYSIFNGTTGKLLQASPYTSKGSTGIVIGHTLDGLSQALLCSTVGSRLTVAMAPGKNSTELGLPARVSVVMVVDVMRSFLPRANGATQPRQPGFPIVVLAPDGTPGVTIPATSPPSTLKIAVLKQGDGTAVKKGDSVVMQYTGILWKAKSVFESTWSKGQPATLVATSKTSVQNSVVPGFAKAIIGQKVGSQILAIVPPSQGYGSKGNGGMVGGGQTLIYVIDILGIA